MNGPPILPSGFRAGGIAAGIKARGGPDLGLLLADQAWPAVALFTQNRLLGAHVALCREHLRRSQGRVRAVLVNSGNANCATGAVGIADAASLCSDLAIRIGCAPEEVLMVSTGVIGARLPVARIAGALDELLEAAQPDAGADFARAIMTTDTVPKALHIEGCGDEGSFAVTGFAKGSGMIHPDMATMLAFLLTDARTPLDQKLLLRAVADRSFHRVTVDGDTSPNDTVLLWASERTWVRPSKDAEAGDEDPFSKALLSVSCDLARRIAADGEGASRLVTVQVHGAASEAEATLVGRTIATSPLTKTAVTGRDPNWGRILSAAGRCGVPFDAERARVWVGDAVVYREGTPLPENEEAAHEHLKEQREVVLGVDLARGPYRSEVWTCDLTAEYVKINAEYRT